MDRFAVGAILVCLLGVWVVPFFAGTSPTAHSPSMAVADEAGFLPASATPTLAQNDAKKIRGNTGFWRVAQTADGTWWFLSPKGEFEFLNTVTTVVPYQLGRDAEGPHFVSKDWKGSIPSNGDGSSEELNTWATKKLARIRDAGFKGLGAWCHPVFHKHDVPITRDLNVWTWVPPSSKRLYTPQWVEIVEHAIKTQVEPLKDNTNLVGYFIDNELDWGDQFAGPSVYFDHLPPNDPNRLKVIEVIRANWSDLHAFNADWETSLTSWDDLQKWETIPHHKPQAYGRLFTAWLEVLATDYFKITTSLVRKYDPNHLILGVRFRGYAPREVVRACKDYTDVVSLNLYVSDARLDLEQFRMINEESGQPLMITEYSFHSLDGRSGNRNTVGFAAQVLDQQARADAYEQFTTRLARVPWVIGADWFQWGDEPPSGRSHDGEDVNFGIVDVDDRSYDTLVSAIRRTTPMLNPLHLKSTNDDGTGIWRESFASKPVMRVPYLAVAPKLNGELSDWIPQAKLQGVRHSQTVGLERSPLPLPNVYMGWNEQGLYIGMEVFDNDITGAPPEGWWWTRDNVEFWLSTQPVGADQTWYDVNSHQFFFVPNDFPDTNGRNGVVGQWKRAGDALKDNLIPHPAIRDAVRVLPDRYVIEMLIPPSAMHGYDPLKQPNMAFNIHVRNFQHATDYFWSAPKEVMTQLRPNTWGTLKFDPQPAPLAGADAAEAAAQ